MKEQDLKTVLKDFATRVNYARENMKKEEKGQKPHLKALFGAKDNLLAIIESNLAGIINAFDAIDVVDKVIDKEDRKAEKFSDEEISKFDKE